MLNARANLIEAVKHTGAQITNFLRRFKHIGYHYGCHPRAMGGSHTMMGIFKHQALGGRCAKQGRGF